MEGPTKGINKKPILEAISCSECEQLWNGNGVLRCRFFDNAKIEDTDEKHCEDSMYVSKPRNK